MCAFLENLSRKFKCNLNLTRITGTLHADQYTFLIAYRWTIYRMRIVSDKQRENKNPRFKFRYVFLRKSCRLWDNLENIVRLDRPPKAIRCVRFACWIPKAKNIHSEYVILIAFYTTTMVTRKRMRVNVVVHCLFCSYTAKRKSVPLNIDRKVLLTSFIPF